VENRARLTLEVTEAVVELPGADRVGIRFSPGGIFNDMSDSNPLKTFGYVLKQLEPLNLAYAHITNVTAQDIAHGAKEGVGPRELRPFYKGTIVSAGGFTKEAATLLLPKGGRTQSRSRSDYCGSGLPERLRQDAALNKPDEATFYSPGPQGYTDYPTLEPQLK